MSYSWVVKRLWMISSWTILLSRHRGVNCSLEDFKILMLYHRSRGVPLFVLLSKLPLCKWEVISLIGQADSMIFQNLTIQWNPTFVPIDIVELILLVTFRFLLIFHIALIFERSSDWIPSLNMLVLSCEFHSQPDNKSSCNIVHDIIVCVTTNCQVKDEWKRSWHKKNSVTKLWNWDPKDFTWRCPIRVKCYSVNCAVRLKSV